MGGSPTALFTGRAIPKKAFSFNVLSFCLTQGELSSRVLRLTVYHSPRWGAREKVTCVTLRSRRRRCSSCFLLDSEQLLQNLPTWSGRLTMAASSKPIFPKPSATAKTCASTGRPHLPERRGNRASLERRRVPSNLKDFARRGDDVPRQPSLPTIKQMNQPHILRVAITHRSPTFPIDKHGQIMYIMLQYFDCDVIGPFFCRIG